MKHRWNRKGVAEREDDRYKVFFFLPCFSYPSLHSHMIALLCLFSLYLCNLMAYLSFLAFWYTSFCCIPIFLSCHRRYVTLPPLTYSIKLVLKTVISSFKQIYSTNDIHLFIDCLLILCVWQKLHALRSNDALQIICFLKFCFFLLIQLLLDLCYLVTTYYYQQNYSAINECRILIYQQWTPFYKKQYQNFLVKMWIRR